MQGSRHYLKGVNDINEWRDIKGYEGLYKISSTGKIWSIISNKEKKMKINHGYYVIDLYKNGSVKWFRVHRLVAENFIENPHGYPIVLHLDNNKLNNHYKNLKWGTISENTQQAYNDGLIDKNKVYLLTNGQEEIICHGRKELIEITKYSRSSVDEYIKNGQEFKRGKYKGFKIIKQ